MTISAEHADVPASEQPWIRQALEGDYAAKQAFDLNVPMDWTIDGLLPRTGASVWFGPGATGKTQLLLWMSLALASRGEASPCSWLGSAITRRGQILVLTAEDTQENILMRLGKLARRMFPQDSDAAREACGRVHIMSFLSMSEIEFPQNSPTVFSRSPQKGWEPHDRLLGIRHFIEEHNRISLASERPDDQIIGVVMDSATSMAGFDSTDSDGATNLLFYLNRMCRKTDIFWAVIGHTQKDPHINPAQPRENSVVRLRGSAMWSTAPRMVVEVRLACNKRPKKGRSETAPIIKARPDTSVRDMLVVDVAKANVPLNNAEPRYVVRTDCGAFEDVTGEVDMILRTGDSTPDEVPSHPVYTEAELENLRLKAVAKFIELAVGGEPGQRVVRSKLEGLLERFGNEIEHLSDVTECRGPANKPRPKSLGLYLNKLVSIGALSKKGKTLTIRDIAACNSDHESKAA